jgi:hypothetical protein
MQVQYLPTPSAKSCRRKRRTYSHPHNYPTSTSTSTSSLCGVGSQTSNSPGKVSLSCVDCEHAGSPAVAARAARRGYITNTSTLHKDAWTIGNWRMRDNRHDRPGEITLSGLYRRATGRPSTSFTCPTWSSTITSSQY